MKKRTIYLTLGIFLILIVVIISLIYNKNNGISNLSDPIRKGSITENVYGIGTVMANKSYQVRLPLASSVEKIFVREGDFVPKGKPLIQMMDIKTIFAPFDGTVTALPFKVGENLLPQTVVLSFVDLRDRYIIVTLEQQGAILVRAGQKAKLSFEGMREQSFDGIVGSVYSHDTNLLVRIDTKELPKQVLPGMSVDVAVSISQHDQVLVVPVAGVLGGIAKVIRAGSRKSLEIPVKLGFVDGEFAEVISGDLLEGDQLIIRPKLQ